MSTTVDLGKITASVNVGTTTTGAAGTNASVSNSGTTQDAVLNFTIPRGAQGVQGPQGIQGNTGPVGPTGPQGPMGDVAVITPEQQAAFTMYSVPGQNTDGPMTQKAVTDALVAGSISYDNSHGGLDVENVQEALDDITSDLYSYEAIDWVNQTTTLKYYINGDTGRWAAYNSSSAKYNCRILPISTNTKYRLTATDDHPINFALLDNNDPASHVGDIATDWNNGIPEHISAGGSIIVDSGDYTYLYIRNNINSASTDIKYPQKIEKCDTVEMMASELVQTEERVSKLEFDSYAEVDCIPIVPYSVLSTNKFGGSDESSHACLQVQECQKYIVTATASGTNYCFATSPEASSGGDIPLVPGTVVVRIEGNESKKITIPSGCSYLLVYNASNLRPFNIRRLYKKPVTITPMFTYDYIGGSSGNFATESARFENGKNIATPRYIKTSDAFTVKANAIGTFQVYYYDSEFNFLKATVDQYPTADVELEPTPEVHYSYVKILFQREEAFCKANISLNGIFEGDWDVYNVRPSNGYHRIGVMVDVSDARCSDATTSTVQDEIDLRPNYGVIALPTTYSNIGKPTRLIIYCHGSGTYFNFGNSTGFDTNNHVDPTYWLKEGYAVMDIDGNPMWNPSTTHTSNDSHAFRPQAMEAYIAGYKWAIEHYNLYRDGVLLGGRSMGGGNTMYLLRSTCPIPVVAACANLPTSVAMSTESAGKLHIANIRGFIIPDGFTFSNGPMNDNDTQVFYDNWNKGIRYIPSIALCVDTPTTEEWRKNFIKNCCHVGEPYESNRIAACKDLHMIVRSPFKMFGCFEDPNNGYQATAQLYMTMLGNAGQQAEYRLYHSDKATNYPSDSRTAHYYELADPTLRTTVTTIYGEEVTNVPMVYVEMLQFWRRYEQNM